MPLLWFIILFTIGSVLWALGFSAVTAFFVGAAVFIGGILAAGLLANRDKR
jgi:hypothetical protein